MVGQSAPRAAALTGWGCADATGVVQHRLRARVANDEDLLTANLRAVGGQRPRLKATGAERAEPVRQAEDVAAQEGVHREVVHCSVQEGGGGGRTCRCLLDPFGQRSSKELLL